MGGVWEEFGEEGVEDGCVSLGKLMAKLSLLVEECTTNCHNTSLLEAGTVRSGTLLLPVE